MVNTQTAVQYYTLYIIQHSLGLASVLYTVVSAFSSMPFASEQTIVLQLQSKLTVGYGHVNESICSQVHARHDGLV